MRNAPRRLAVSFCSILLTLLSATPAFACITDAECDDGVFCNGVEDCAALVCVQGTPEACDDGVLCTVDACNVLSDACENTAVDALCSDGQFCNGAESCNPITGCEAGTAPDCDDSVACTTDACDEGSDSCDHTADDGACNDGLYCNGSETCDSVNGCEAGTAPDCDDSVACTTDACDEGSDSCDHTADDGACDDGLYCNGSETCDSVNGCEAGTAPDCDDSVACTTDACDEAGDSCDHTADDGACDDGLYCNGSETCDSVSGCEAGTAPDCDDSVACTTDACDEGSDSCDHTIDDGACDDGLYCNGSETCDSVSGCEAGTAPDCDDSVACTTDACDEGSDSCDHTADDGACDDGLYCNGSETCDSVNGCEAGTAPDCDDSVACTTDACDEGSDSCDHTADDGACDDGLYCNGSETCDSVSGCEAGTAPDCDDSVACTTDACDEGSDSCDHTTDDGACDDGLYCNGSETCDSVNGCEAGTAPDCDDSVACTTDACDEGSDSCDHTTDDGACNDGLYCNGPEACDSVNGCEASTAPSCDDGLGCTTDACDESSDSCDHTASDAACDDGLYCNGSETCDIVNGCESGTAPNCSDGVACTTDACDESGDSCNHTTDDGACDDGLYCNGSETCDSVNGCEAGTAPDCDDSVACTTDACDEGSDSCDHTTDDGACNDGLYCNGPEACDSVNGCEASTAPSCDDGLGCTTDACDESSDSCDHTASDAACDDGLYCNGSETCDAVNGCESGTAPNCSDGVACTTDVCDESGDSCDHPTDDGTCDDGLFCNGSETCDSVNGCEAGTAPDCDDSVACTTDVCDESGDSCDHTTDDGACDDGLFCNGVETCDSANGCEASTAPSCDDGVGCTLDACVEGDDSCTHTPDNSACDNLAYCDGAETCDPLNGCQSGTQPCSDGVNCTSDSCNENADSCSYAPDDGACDDGLYCNGTETCDALLDCQAGTAVECTPDDDPCRDAVCDEESSGCAPTSVNDGGGCDDENDCTQDDACDAGECTGQSLCPEPCQRCDEGACFEMCGAPFTSGVQPTASDGLFILHAAVGLRECALCVCDVNSTSTITALDGLYVVRKAVGLSNDLTCPSATTTTTSIQGGSTTTSSVAETSTTTTTP